MTESEAPKAAGSRNSGFIVSRGIFMTALSKRSFNYASPDPVSSKPAWIPASAGMTCSGSTARFAIILENGSTLRSVGGRDAVAEFFVALRGRMV